MPLFRYTGTYPDGLAAAPRWTWTVAVVSAEEHDPRTRAGRAAIRRLWVQSRLSGAGGARVEEAAALLLSLPEDVRVGREAASPAEGGAALRTEEPLWAAVRALQSARWAVALGAPPFVPGDRVAFDGGDRGVAFLCVLGPDHCQIDVTAHRPRAGAGYAWGFHVADERGDTTIATAAEIAPA